MIAKRTTKILRGKNTVEVNSCLRDSMVHVVNWIPSSYCALIEGQRQVQEKRPHAHRVGGCIWESGVLQRSPERTFTLCSQCDPVTERGDVILGQIHSEPVQTSWTREQEIIL